MPDETPPPELPAWVSRAIVGVLGTMAVLAGLATFLDLPPGPTVAGWIADENGVYSVRLQFTVLFVLQGLVVLAILVPAAVLRNLTDR